MHLHELGHVELGALKNLHLADVHVLKGVDASAHLLDLLADHLGDELVDELAEGDRRRLALRGGREEGGRVSGGRGKEGEVRGARRVWRAAMISPA